MAWKDNSSSCNPMECVIPSAELDNYNSTILTSEINHTMASIKNDIN